MLCVYEKSRVEKRIEEGEKEIRKKKNKEWAGTLYAEGPRVPGSQGDQGIFKVFWILETKLEGTFLQGNPPSNWHTKWRERYH